jgi:hypothetical protein
MRRQSPAKIATLVFVMFTLAAPVFAAPPRDDSPIRDIEQTIGRIFDRVVQILDVIGINLPK